MGERKEIYIGFWAGGDDVEKLDELVRYYKEKYPFLKISRSAVIRMLIDEKYQRIKSGESN